MEDILSSLSLRVYPVIKRLVPIPAHGSYRGGSPPFAPEDTMYGYKKAVFEYKTQILHCSVYQSQDQKLFLHQTNRIQDAKGKWSQPFSTMPLAQARQFDLAHDFSTDGGKTFPLRGQDHKIVTFDELLDEFTPVENLVFFLDIRDPNAVVPTLNIIKDRNLADKFILTTLNDHISSLLNDFMPPDMLSAPRIHGSAMYTIARALEGKHPLPDHVLRHDMFLFVLNERSEEYFTPSLFELIRARGKHIAVYGETLDDPEVIKKMVNLKADIIFSSRPEILRETFNNLGIGIDPR